MARRATKPRASRPVLALEREKVSLASMVWEIPTLRRLILSHLDTTAFKQCMLLNRATRADGLAERFRTLRRPWQARKSRRKGKYAGQTIPNDLELSEREIKYLQHGVPYVKCIILEDVPINGATNFHRVPADLDVYQILNPDLLDLYQATYPNLETVELSTHGRVTHSISMSDRTIRCCWLLRDPTGGLPPFWRDRWADRKQAMAEVWKGKVGPDQMDLELRFGSADGGSDQRAKCIDWLRDTKYEFRSIKWNVASRPPLSHVSPEQRIGPARALALRRNCPTLEELDLRLDLSHYQTTRLSVWAIDELLGAFGDRLQRLEVSVNADAIACRNLADGIRKHMPSLKSLFVTLQPPTGHYWPQKDGFEEYIPLLPTTLVDHAVRVVLDQHLGPLDATMSRWTTDVDRIVHIIVGIAHLTAVFSLRRQKATAYPYTGLYTEEKDAPILGFIAREALRVAARFRSPDCKRPTYSELFEEVRQTVFDEFGEALDKPEPESKPETRRPQKYVGMPRPLSPDLAFT